MGGLGAATTRHVGTGIGSAAPTPVLVDGLSVQTPTDDVVAAVHASISPISDVRCSAEYRAFMAETFTRRLLEEVA